MTRQWQPRVKLSFDVHNGISVVIGRGEVDVSLTFHGPVIMGRMKRSLYSRRRLVAGIKSDIVCR